ncbi:MAG TPA: DUF1223 domain-containing protein [Brevundimonas sp.]|jgi:hypothetical protein|uniref:DUF1223 domain-containing protein n=1 Tax=Brevundimonas sp. TaxID=1871086 RepID=UPI002DE2130F|nr:DUF1223 domain-containing protein [Brevundimonas sp.]
MRIGGIVAAALAALVMGGAQTSAQTGARPTVVAEEPVVVELFTAQGCAGCPEANGVVERLADQADVILLTWPVDYWDWLGWKDTLARPSFSARQRQYVEALRLRAPATPQVIIDGRRVVTAAAGPLDVAVTEAAARRDWPPEVEFRADGDRVGVGSGRVPQGGADVVAVIYTPGVQSVRVGSGDNRGKTVRQVNVVRTVARLGAWTGRPEVYALPEALGDRDGVAVLVQSRGDRRILGAARR